MKAVVAVKRGARFFLDGEAVMFEFVMDSRSRTAPRLATSEDRDRYPEAWRAAGEIPEINPSPIVVVEGEEPPPSAAQRPFADRREAARREGRFA